MWVDDLVLFAQKDAVIRDIKLFKAVVNGRQINLDKTVHQEKANFSREKDIEHTIVDKKPAQLPFAIKKP